jgi:hypothetical protein
MMTVQYDEVFFWNSFVSQFDGPSNGMLLGLLHASSLPSPIADNDVVLVVVCHHQITVT